MKLVVGLGNPDKKYEKTRHNCGFRAIDFYAEKNNLTFKSKFKGLYCEQLVNNEKLILLKPQTYMNLSGECIRPVCDYYKVDPSECIVAFDDISLEPGKIRIRKKGSAGGHNGIKSIISCLGTDAFPRLKFGVGDKPKQMDLADYVLGRFNSEDEAIVAKELEKACNAIECMVTEGYDAAMNKYNGV